MSIFHNAMDDYCSIQRHHRALVSQGTSVFAKSKIHWNNQIYFPVHKPNSFDQALCSVERHLLVFNYPFAAL